MSLKRRYLLAICLLLLVLLSGLTFLWLTPKRPIHDIIVLKSYSSLSDAIQGILGGEVDLLPIDKIDLQTLRAFDNSKVKLVSIPSFDFTYIGLNLRNWPLNDNNLRKAMLYAFNRPNTLNQVLGRLGETLQPSLFSSAYSTNGWPTSIDLYSYDPVKAKSLLDKEGFTLSSPFRIDSSTGNTLKRMSIISRLGQPTEVAAADLFAKDMQTIGLPVVSVPMQDRDFDLAMRTYSFDLFVDSQSANSAPTWLYKLFYSMNDIAPVPLGTNLVGYKSSRFDDYVSKFMAARNQNEIQNVTKTCQEILTADLPVIPIFSKHLLIAASSKLPVTMIVGSISDTVRSTAVNIMKNSDFSAPLRIGFISDFDNLDPTTSSNQADWIAIHLLTESLLSVDGQGRVKPNLAKQWTLSDDGTLITMTLRQDAKFNNGLTITIDDVITTLNWLMRNVKPSSPLYSIMKEIVRSYALDQQTLRIVLATPDKFAINSFTNIFALPESRLMNPTILDPLISQQLLSSGPFVLRKFTQRDGVYMQLNNPYFGKPAQNLESIQAFEEVTIQGTRVFSGNEVKISSSPILLGRKPVGNATYRVCIYDQNDFVTQCVAGKYAGQGRYTAALSVDSRFRAGIYRVMSTVYGTSGNGAFVIVEEKTMVIRAFPIVLTLVGTLIFVIAIAAVKRELARSRRRRKIRRISRKRTLSKRIRQSIQRT